MAISHVRVGLFVLVSVSLFNSRARLAVSLHSHRTTIEQAIMVASMRSAKAILLCLGSSVLAQNIDPTYGDNYTPVNKDDEAISRNYPDIDIDLLSPAFLNPETVPPGFANGTSGPTPDFVMSKLVIA